MKFLVQQQPAFVYTGGKPFDPSKPSVVFIHGAANDHSVWTLKARYFAHHGFNALAVDLPGHGKSFGGTRDAVAAYADWMVNLLDNGAIADAAIVGHSMGSLIALDLAARHPARVRALVLIGTSVPMPVAEPLLDAARHRPHEAFDMLNVWGHAPQMKWGKSPIPGTSLMMSYKRLLEKSGDQVLYKDLTACNQFQMDEAALKRIAAPTLVLSGTRDMMTPPKTAALVAKRIAGAKFVSFEGSGHALMQEAPGAVLDQLKTFIRI
jgi:pimeloyl-ACP methyl ester carboxylesterase